MLSGAPALADLPDGQPAGRALSCAGLPDGLLDGQSAGRAPSCADFPAGLLDGQYSGRAPFAAKYFPSEKPTLPAPINPAFIRITSCPCDGRKRSLPVLLLCMDAASLKPNKKYVIYVVQLVPMPSTIHYTTLPPVCTEKFLGLRLLLGTVVCGRGLRLLLGTVVCGRILAFSEIPPPPREFQTKKISPIGKSLSVKENMPENPG